MQAVMKEIPGFDGYYISRTGEVYSTKSRNGRGLYGPLRRMRIFLNKDGYKSVSLRHPTGPVRRGIHQLLLCTYVGPCPDGMMCRHLNGDKLDNRLSNLCWGTCAENASDMLRHGTTTRGEKHNKAKLTTNQVVEIYNRVHNGEEQSVLAKEFGVCQQTISSIKNRHTWSHTTD